MPWTGYDPEEHGGPIDMTGGGLDPSYAWSLAPGGRFPGDEWAYLEYLAALEPSGSRIDEHGGPGAPNPDYHVPDWLKNNKSIIGKLLALHEKNVQEGGLGAVSNPLGGGGNSLHSGPGADYGPLSGPTRGLWDQEGNIFDGPDHRPEGSSDSVPAGGGKGHGGGGGYNGPVGPMIPNQPNYSPSFLGWQPNNTGAPQFTGAANARATAPAVPIPQGPTPPPGGWQGKWRGPNRGGGAGTAPAGSGGSGGAGGAGGGTGSGGGTGKGGTYTIEDAARELGLSPEDLKGLGIGIGGMQGGKSAHPKQDLGGEGFKGYDVNMMGSNAPGWLRDPTSSTYDTSGMPNPTAPARLFGEGNDDYMTRLHDAGFNMRDIATLVGNGTSGFGMGGTVVRGPDGSYHFGNELMQGEGYGASDWNALVGKVVNDYIGGQGQQPFSLDPGGKLGPLQNNAEAWKAAGGDPWANPYGGHMGTEGFLEGRGGAGGGGAGGVDFGPNPWAAYQGAFI